MLVFISDLHFVDESAGKHNIPASAYRKFLGNIKVHADKAKTEKVTIVFLGDIFDLVRTEHWFDVDKKDRPWGDITDNMYAEALNILEMIAAKNSETFELFTKSSLREVFGDIPVETIYIPGNHDRLCALNDDLKGRVVNLLGLDSANDSNFKFQFSDTSHGVFALHGHCFDKFNYEGGNNRTFQDYSLVPIGDPITTELVAKLPYQLMINVRKAGILDEEEEKALERNFQEIENVRPFSATLKWLLYHVDANRKVKHIIEDSVDQVVREFKKLPYYKKWLDRHDVWYNPFDNADKIQAVLYFLEKFKVMSTGRLLELVKKIGDLFSKDDCLEGARKLFETLDSRIQYVVMGHTHDPLKKAVRRSDNEKIIEHVYLNTGTWRKRFHQCTGGGGFIGWKDMTCVIFYTPDEKPNRYDLPVFETWTGSLKREEIEPPDAT